MITANPAAVYSGVLSSPLLSDLSLHIQAALRIFILQIHDGVAAGLQ